METRRIILYCAASAAVSAMVAATVTAAAVREGVRQPELSLPDPEPRSQAGPEAEAYILGEWDGRLAVYRPGETEPESVLDVYLGLLPPADAQALREGIPVADDEELDRRLEDFMS